MVIADLEFVNGKVDDLDTSLEESFASVRKINVKPTKKTAASTQSQGRICDGRNTNCSCLPYHQETQFFVLDGKCACRCALKVI